MSSGAKIAIAAFALLCGISIAGVTLSSPEAFPNPVGMYVFSAFCVLIAVACAPGKVGLVAGRIIGGLVFAGYIWYIFIEATAPKVTVLSGSRGAPDLAKAIVGFLLLGLPAGLFAIFGEKVVEKFKSLNTK